MTHICDDGNLCVVLFYLCLHLFFFFSSYILHSGALPYLLDGITSLQNSKARFEGTIYSIIDESVFQLPWQMPGNHQFRPEVSNSLEFRGQPRKSSGRLDQSEMCILAWIKQMKSKVFPLCFSRKEWYVHYELYPYKILCEKRIFGLILSEK